MNYKLRLWAFYDQSQHPPMTPEGLAESEYRAIVSDAKADALLECGAHCVGGGDPLGLVVGIIAVAFVWVWVWG
ncbi:hypothetical protein D0962_09525 [Leptolyngbyaceae cyanobacterium CCMR0082]|uniref:Uncharacterized protein n=1 Tax=Adonisia turfae CCMR0082 TaxID=2304604 RepID=A0A6M0S3M3_9CYAN|nr:hypothetical protein [Adonisia turfae CCMR0082]